MATTIYWYDEEHVTLVNTTYYLAQMTSDDDFYYGYDDSDIYDYVIIGNGDDTIYTYAGDDFITVNVPVQIPNDNLLIYAGEGDDSVFLGNATGTITAYGEGGTDGFNTSYMNPLYAPTSVYLYGGDGIDGFSLFWDSGFGYEGNGTDFYCYGGNGNDAFESYNDSESYTHYLDGGSGSDNFRVYLNGTVEVHGGDGQDYFRPDEFADVTNTTVYGDAGDDVLVNWSVVDVSVYPTNVTMAPIYGGDGDDFISNVTLRFGDLWASDEDSLVPLGEFYGGGDDDIYHISFYESKEIHYTIEDTGGSDDRLYVSVDTGQPESFSKIEVVGTDLVLTYTDNEDVESTITIKNQYPDCSLAAASVIEFIHIGDTSEYYLNSVLLNPTPSDTYEENYWLNIYASFINLGLSNNVTIATPVIGTSGNDNLNGDANDNYIIGGDGDDTIHGGDGNDILHGCDGQDVLYGENGNDTLYGGDGSDSLYGGAGDDSMYGGANTDTFYGGAGDDTIDGGGQISDAVNYSSSPSSTNIDLGAGTAEDGFGDTDTLIDISHATGSDYDDIIVGNGSTNALYGGGGNDHIYGDDGTDSDLGDGIYGGDGNDHLYGYGGDDELEGGTGSDCYYFNIGDGSDSIEDASGSLDYIVFGVGIDPNDLVFTVNGNDLSIDYGSDDITIVDQLNGAGTKQIERFLFADGSTFTVANYASWAFGTSGANSPTLTSSPDYYWGDAGNDTISGSAGNDELNGGAGNDTVNGGDGDDLITGGTGNDTLNGDSNNDTIYGGDGDDTINGGANNDTMIGGLGVDQLTGGSGTDTYYDFDENVAVRISGSTETGSWAAGTYDRFTDQSGANTYYQQTGDALIQGGSGNDAYHMIFTLDDTPGYKVIITETGGTNTLYLDSIVSGNENYYWTFGWNNSFGSSATNFISDLTFHYTGTSTETQIKIANEYNLSTPQYIVQYIQFAGESAVYIEDMPFFIKGTSGADTLNGDSNGNYIVTLNGGDAVDAGAGDDFVGTGSGNDTIYGGDGNDSIKSFDGDDTIYGGAGNDRIETYAGSNLIYCGDGDDVVETGLVSGGDTADIIYGENGNDSLSAAGSGHHELYGGAGNDTLSAGSDGSILDGGGGNDKMTSGSGNDVFIYSSGVDEIFESNGTDTLIIQGGTTINDITVSDFNYSGNNDAKIVIAASTDEIILQNFRQSASKQVEILQFDDGFQTELLASYNGWLKGTSGNDSVTGNGSDNVLIGYAGNDSINSGAGADDAHGGAGNDVIHGDGGADLLHGGGGDDILYGDDGQDTLYGGGGSDTFVFEDTEAFNNVDLVKDYATGDGDSIDIMDILDSHYTYGIDDLTDFVQITDNGTDSTLSIDQDGAAGGANFVAVALIIGVTGLTNEVSLESAGALITH